MNPSRRRWWLGASAVAGLAGASGLGVGLWRDGASGGGQASGPDATLALWWRLEFPKPDGGVLRTAGFRGRPLLLNFWATWCPPCVQEMPALDRFARRPGSPQLLGLAADNAEPVRAFLQRQPVGYPVGLAGFAGIEWSRLLGNPQGSLPFSVLFGADGRVRDTHLGELAPGDLERWARVT